MHFTSPTKLAALSVAAILPIALAAPAMAQSTDGQADIYVGGQVGYHDLGSNPIGANDGAVYGIYAGVDVPVSGPFVIGAEVNYNMGSNAIDEEYGIAAKLGVNVGDKGQLFVRGGYQEVNFDLGNVIGGPIPAGLDDTDGDYLVGVGGQYKLAPNTSLRVTLDTIAFDTTRVMGGVAFHF